MFIEKITTALSKVPGAAAIALGGSRSREEAGPDSDYDIGLYYRNGNLDLAALGACLKSLDDGHGENLLNAPGQWGLWINGGGWITVDGTPVDILLRDMDRVEAVLEDCISGRISIDYQCGHPFGFVNAIYAAETHYCRPLWQDGAAPLDRLKALLYSKGPYSPQMKESIINKFLWEAWFSLSCGRKAAFKGDVNYAGGSVFRAVCSWIEVLFALNETYLMNEKGALSRIKGLGLRPEAMEERVNDAYKLIASTNAKEAYLILESLHDEIAALTSGSGTAFRIR